MAPKIKRYAGSRELREWALGLSDENRKRLGIENIDVSNRGRFHSKLVQAFNREHRADGVRYVPIARDVPRLDESFESADKGDDDKPEVYRQPRQEKKEDAAPVPPTPLPVPQPQATVQPQGVAPAAVMELLRSGQNVVVVYVPVEMAAAV